MDDFNLEGMNGPSHIDSPQTRGYRQFNGLTNKPPQAPREQGQTMMAVVEKGEEVAQLDGEDPPHAWPGHFRLMDLPAELRVYIYEFLLPHNMNISFELRRSYYDFFTTRTVAHPDTPQWRMELTSRGPGPTAQAQQKALPDRQDDSSSKRWSLVPLPNPEPAQTQLFLVSKAISAEAKGTPSPSPVTSTLTHSKQSSTAQTPTSSPSTATPTSPSPGGPHRSSVHSATATASHSCATCAVSPSMS